MNIQPSINDLNELKQTADNIIKQATRDLMIWTAISKETQCQIATISKVSKKKEQ